MIQNFTHIDPTSAERGIPFVCGGRQNGVYTDICYKYEAAQDEWIILETMTEPRGWCGHASSDYWGMVIAGGTIGDGFLSSVERTANAEVFTPLPNLPMETQESCVVIIDDRRLLNIGGYPTASDTLLFSDNPPTTGSWSR